MNLNPQVSTLDTLNTLNQLQSAKAISIPATSSG